MKKRELLELSDSKLNEVAKVQGTMHDRRRKVNKTLIYRMNRMLNSGKPVSYIADHYGISDTAVRYNTDEDYKKWKNEERLKYKRSESNKDTAELADYKRTLIRNNKKLVVTA